MTLTLTLTFRWYDCQLPWAYFKVIGLLHIKFLKNGGWYGKSYYRLLIGNHTLSFDWCHFWWPWSTFKGHFSLGCHFHVHFSNPWHAFASHGLPAIAELVSKRYEFSYLIASQADPLSLSFLPVLCNLREQRTLPVVLVASSVRSVRASIALRSAAPQTVPAFNTTWTNKQLIQFRFDNYRGHTIYLKYLRKAANNHNNAYLLHHQSCILTHQFCRLLYHATEEFERYICHTTISIVWGIHFWLQLCKASWALQS